MLELLINPKKAEREPWQMFFVGLIYGSFSILLAYWFFAKDIVNSQYIGWIVVLFCVIFCLPFVYYTVKLEERKDSEYDGEIKILKEHRKAINSFIWLFLGFVVAFSLWHIILPDGPNLLKAQIETFCQINNPDNFNFCTEQYGVKRVERITGTVTSRDRLLSIFSNNVQVLIFTMIFSLIFGAGAIFVLAWNASVIAAAIGIFTKMNVHQIPLGLIRYMIHGTLEIAAYFIAALAGGIFSLSLIRKEYKSERFWLIVEDSLTLTIIALAILFISAIIEVFITPKLF